MDHYQYQESTESLFDHKNNRKNSPVHSNLSLLKIHCMISCIVIYFSSNVGFNWSLKVKGENK